MKKKFSKFTILSQKIIFFVLLFLFLLLGLGFLVSFKPKVVYAVDVCCGGKSVYNPTYSCPGDIIYGFSCVEKSGSVYLNCIWSFVSSGAFTCAQPGRWSSCISHDSGCSVEKGPTIKTSSTCYIREDSCAGSSTPAPDPPTPTPIPTPSCTVNLTPVSTSISVGASTDFSSSVVPSGTVDQVNFSSGDTGVATVDPSFDASSPYRTSATGVSVGSSTITSNVVMSGVVRCTDTSTLDVTPPGPWWQVEDADIITNGNLFSLILTTTCFLPGCDPAFGLEGSGGYPGVPSYGGSYDFEIGSGTGTVSSTGWLANSMTTLNKVYDYSYFQSMVRPDVEINEIIEPEIQGGYLINQGNTTRGYVWFKRQGDLTLTGTANLQDRKVVLLVDGDLYLGRPPAQSGSKIQVRDGSGFFMAIVSGDIIISPKAEIDPLNPEPVFEGIFLAEGQIKTGTEGPGLDEQLWIRGSVAAYGGVVLERNLTDNSVTPAEFFEYGPDLLFTFPRDLTSRRYKWKEIAP